MAARNRDPWQQALDALSHRALSREEIRRKLLRAGHAGERVAEVIEKLDRLSLVDDRAVAYNHAHHRAREARRGSFRVRGELLRRGLSPELVDEVLDEVFPPERREVYFRRVVARLAGREGEPADRTARERLARKLMRAGFPGGQVSSWLGESPGDGYDMGSEDE